MAITVITLCVEHESVYLRDHSASVAGGAERLHLPPNLRDVDFGKSGVFVTACGMRVWAVLTSKQQGSALRKDNEKCNGAKPWCFSSEEWAEIHGWGTRKRSKEKQWWDGEWQLSSQSFHNTYYFKAALQTVLHYCLRLQGHRWVSQKRIRTCRKCCSAVYDMKVIIGKYIKVITYLVLFD